MNWADWAIAAILVVSALISLKRGFVREAFSLANWVVAFFIAVAFRDLVAMAIGDYIAANSIREMAAFGLLFVATLIVGALINNLLVELVRMTGLSGTDRMLGMVFGLARGLVVIMAILLLVPLIIPIDKDDWWQESLLIPELLTLEGMTRDVTDSVTELVKGFLSKSSD